MWMYILENHKLFNFDFEFFAFSQTQILKIQSKILYGSLFSLATSIIHHILIIFSPIVTDLIYYIFDFNIKRLVLEKNKKATS